MELMVGNKAVAYGAKLARIEVTSAYPITPQTTIVQYLAEFVAKGELDAKFIEVESEISAQISVQGASFVGARTFTATSGPGLLYMHHPMYGLRRPVVMAVVHRGAKSMQPDHTDLMAQRDTGLDTALLRGQPGGPGHDHHGIQDSRGRAGSFASRPGHGRVHLELHSGAGGDP